MNIKKLIIYIFMYIYIYGFVYTMKIIIRSFNLNILQETFLWVSRHSTGPTLLSVIVTEQKTNYKVLE